MDKTAELKVFITARDTSCEECGEELPRGSWITLEEKTGCLCLSCAELDQLVFLPSGNAALTRRSKRASKRHAVVLKWSRARKRYERQGLLVEEAALQQAEGECLQDEEIRARRREREADRREQLDNAYVDAFAARVRELYPKTPHGRERMIAEHACRKYSGRVGRSASAKELDTTAIKLAVVAHIRHHETDYDEILFETGDRPHARSRVKDQVAHILAIWSGS